MTEIRVNVVITASPELTKALAGICSCIQPQSPQNQNAAESQQSTIPPTLATPNFTPQVQAPIQTQQQPPVQMPIQPPVQQQPYAAPQIAPQQQMHPTQAPPVAMPPVASAPAYTKDQLARAGSALVDAGKQQEVTDCLSRFGVQTLRDLPESNYGELATMFRQLGAQI